MDIEYKSESILLDGTPTKRSYWSLMNDYDCKTAIVELVDNCFDIWSKSSPSSDLRVEIVFDIHRQLISIRDNAGGLSSGDLSLFITPGGSNNDPYDHSIGVFGVGSKRAAVALAEVIRIETRRGLDQTYRIDIDNDWLDSSVWELPAYKCPNIGAGETLLSFSSLRRVIRESDLQIIEQHLGETYGLFLRRGRCTIILNDTKIEAITFDKWAYPECFPPNNTLFEIQPEPGRIVTVAIEAGLILDRISDGSNYGVYIYCNGRLIEKEIKSRDVGYNITSESGRPHPDASLCRVIVEFDGPARLMPWNSSKTAIIGSIPSFLQASKTIIKLCSFFTKVSRRLKNSWEEDVFPYTVGEMVEISPEEAIRPDRLVPPALPRARRDSIEKLAQNNAATIQEKPYVLPLIESVEAVELILRQKFNSKNRLALIILDSTFEISVKEYLVNNVELFGYKVVEEAIGARTKAVNLLKTTGKLPDVIYKHGEYYYNIRNKLIHERATVSPSDQEIRIYVDTIKDLLFRLYYVKWDAS